MTIDPNHLAQGFSLCIQKATQPGEIWKPVAAEGEHVGFESLQRLLPTQGVVDDLPFVEMVKPLGIQYD